MLDKTRTEAQQTNQTQLATISALRRELDRTRQMLEGPSGLCTYPNLPDTATVTDAREVGADDAERFLGLLDNVQFGSMKNKQNAVRLMAGSEPRRSSEEYDFTQADDDPDFLRRHVPDSKAEAILGLAADEPGGVSTKARQRAADRHRRLDNALSTIAVSRRPLCVFISILNESLSSLRPTQPTSPSSEQMCRFHHPTKPTPSKSMTHLLPRQHSNRRIRKVEDRLAFSGVDAHPGPKPTCQKSTA